MPVFSSAGDLYGGQSTQISGAAVLGVVDPIGDQRGCKMEEWITLLQANFIPEG